MAVTTGENQRDGRTGGAGEKDRPVAVELDGRDYFLRLFHSGTSVRVPVTARNDRTLDFVG